MQGNLAHSTRPDEAGADGRDAGTGGNVREAMHGAWAAVVDVHGMVQEDTHWEEAMSRNHVGPLEHGSGSTHSRHPHPVAVQVQPVRGQRLCARQCCYWQTGSAARSCCSQ